MSAPPVVLAVAGSDSGGAAGLAADLATISAFDCHGACVVTAVTAQDTTGVHAIHQVPLDDVAAQADAVVADLPVAVVKTGMLGTPRVVRLVAERLGRLAIVVDPVLVATSGAVLGDEEVARAYVRHLIPSATLVTPNLDEARVLAGRDGTPADLAARLADLGCAVVVTGGEGAVDWLALPGSPAKQMKHPRVETSNDHGTGCTFASAIAAGLAHGRDVDIAIRDAAAFVADQLTVSRDWDLGRGRGSIAHTAPVPAKENQ